MTRGADKVGSGRFYRGLGLRLQDGYRDSLPGSRPMAAVDVAPRRIMLRSERLVWRPNQHISAV